MSDEVPLIGRTALVTAAGRATESRRAEPLFVDPWAQLFLDAYQRAAPPTDPADTVGDQARDTELWNLFNLYFAARTPFFDAAVRDGVAAGAGQVVILAAGLDARAGRLDLPSGVRVFEVDTAPVLEFKARALAAAGLDVARRVPVVADLTADWPAALRAAGHRPDVPTVWLAEGLLFYLDAATCDRLLDAVLTLTAPGSRLAVEYIDRRPQEDDATFADADDHRTANAILALIGEGPPAPPREWLGARDVTVDRFTDVATEITAQGRTVPTDLDPRRAEALTIWLASGVV